MSLACGFFNVNGALDAARLTETVRQFSPMASLRAEAWPVETFTAARGGLFAKWMPDGVKRVSAAPDAAGNVLLLLGFHDFADSYLRLASSGSTLPTEELLRRLEEGEGEFVAIVLEPGGTIHIINDRFASQPFYLLERQGVVLFSSNLALLQRMSGAAPALDPLGVMQMFAYLHTLGPRTVLEGARKLDPAVHVTLSEQGFAQRAYWRLRYQVDPGLDPEAFADEVWAAYVAASRMRHQGRKGLIAISGGLDSRVLAGSVPPEDFIAFTRNESLEEKPTREARLAGDVARGLGLRHQISRFPEGEFSRVALDLALLVGGMYPLNHPIKSYVPSCEAREAGGLFMSGVAGGTLAGGFVPTLEFVASPINEGLKRQFIGGLTRQNRGSLALVFRREVMNELFPRLEPSLIETFAGIEGPTAGHWTTAWTMIVRQPSFSFLSSARNHPGIMDATPHLGYRFSDLMLRLPAPWLYDKNFYKLMIYRNMPSVREVPYFNTGEKLEPRLRDYTEDLKKGAWREEKKWSFRRWARGVLPPAVLHPFSRLPFQEGFKPVFYHQVLSRDKVLHAAMREILHAHAPLGELFDVPRCERFLDSLAAGRVHGYTPKMDVNLMGALLSACYFYHGLK